MNRDLGGDFRLDRFAHRAIWDAELSHIEMHLESLQRQTIRLAGWRVQACWTADDQPFAEVPSWRPQEVSNPTPDDLRVAFQPPQAQARPYAAD